MKGIGAGWPREGAGVRPAGMGSAGAASVQATERKVQSRAAAACINLARRVQRGVGEGERGREGSTSGK